MFLLCTCTSTLPSQSACMFRLIADVRLSSPVSVSHLFRCNGVAIISYFGLFIKLFFVCRSYPSTLISYHKILLVLSALTAGLVQEYLVFSYDSNRLLVFIFCP